MTRRMELCLLGGILLFALFLRLAFLHEPLERDEGLYAYIGQVILDGGIPYRDAIDHKPPGVHYLYALMIFLGGAHPEAIRLLTALYSLGTVWFVYLSARLLGGSTSGLAAALICGVVASGPQLHGSSSNTEVFLLLPLTAGLYLLLKWRRDARLGLLAACGFCCALAMLIKTVAFPMVLLFLTLSCRPREGRDTVRDGLLRGLVFLAPLVATGGAVLLYFAGHGALADFWHWNLVFNRVYGADAMAGGSMAALRQVAPKLMEHLPLWLTALPAIWYVIRRQDLRAWPVVLMVPAAMVGVMMPGRYFPHYFLLFLPPLAILAGLSCRLMRDLAPTARRSALAALGLVWLALAVMEYPWYLVYSPDEIVSRKYPGYRFAMIARLARDVHQRTRSGDTIFQWGFEPELYFLSDRRSASRYTVDQFVGADRNPREAAAKLGRDLASRKPFYIIVIPQGNTEWHGYLELMNVLARFYVLEQEIDGARLFRLQDSQKS